MDRVFTHLPRTAKKRVAFVYDLLVISASLWISMHIRASFGPFEFNPRPLDLFALALAPTVAVWLFSSLGVYKTVVRYAPHRIFLFIFAGLCVSAFTLIFSSFYLHTFIPRSVPLIFLLVALVAVSLPRLVIRNLVDILHPIDSKPVIIYGSGSSAIELAKTLKSDKSYRTVAFVDHEGPHEGSSIDGIPVYSPESLDTLVAEQKVQLLLLAIENESKRERLTIIRSLERFPVKVQSIPPIRDIIGGVASISQLHDIDIADLLGREPVSPDYALMSEHIFGKNVLITGAGGSIGAELCRQIVHYNPKTLVLYDSSEYNLYRIYEELSSNIASNPILAGVNLVPILGNVLDRELMKKRLANLKLDIVYHAAAYKHVPMVEANAFEGVRNNLLGTLHCAELAKDLGVKTFVLVSTDKAVRPTNVMGASKRLAELVLQALARESSSTVFCMVRFGNVLNSSGSVVPRFREQIENGGPVTVTHPEITRFFMTIEEAAQLVVQAGAMAKGGEVFVLDMGDPVRIYDLAREMILLSGRTVKDASNPNGDIEIEITGIRSGEKLFEELLIGENCSPTAHPRILMAEEFSLSWRELQPIIDEVGQQCTRMDYKELQAFLIKSPIAYAPLIAAKQQAKPAAAEQEPAGKDARGRNLKLIVS